MDSVTQAVLGTAVGEAVLGKKAGNNDIRFGRSDGWLRDEGAYVFSLRIRRDPADTTRVTAIKQIPFLSNLDGTTWRPLFARIGGR
jgi:hypothetical protein